jgi:WD40 repeat protein
VSDDGSLLASDSSYPETGKVQVWSLETGERIRTWAKPRGFARGLMLSGDGAFVTAAWSDGSLTRWDVATGAERSIAESRLEKARPNEQIIHAVFSRDGQSIAMVERNWVHVVDSASGRERFKERSFGHAVEFAPNGRSLVTIRPGKGTMTKMANGLFRSDNSRATSTILWLDSQTGHVRREIEIAESGVNCVAFSPDGELLAAGTSFHSKRGILRVYRLRDRKELQSMETECPWIQAVSFTPDGKRIVAGFPDTSIVIWDVRSRDSR